MKLLKTNSKYPAYTLMEMLIVISIFIILGGMTFASFYGLQNTVKMNEYMVTLEQDIRSVQRASMLLERNPMEKWLYGLGIDFSNMVPDGNYRTFKWCSPESDYGDITTASKVPAYDGTSNIDSTDLPTTIENATVCGNEVLDSTQLRTLLGYERSLTIPISTVAFSTDSRYVLFESVSGRAFFYDEGGKLLNYQYNLSDDKFEIVDYDDVQNFVVTITPLRGGSPRQLTINHLSGRIDNQFRK